MSTPEAIAKVVALCRRSEDGAVQEVADHLAELLADGIRAEPDHRARDEVVREVSGLFFGEAMSKARRAELLAAEIARYRGGSDWHDRDRFCAGNPYRKGDRRHWLWKILRAVDTAPSARRLRAILR